MINRTLDRPSASYSTAAQSSSREQPLFEAGDVQQFIEPVEKLILNYPAVALASAFLIGVALACWIKRK
jgi:hypothetical protein